jgi:hypothetical protein
MKRSNLKEHLMKIETDKSVSRLKNRLREFVKQLPFLAPIFYTVRQIFEILSKDAEALFLGDRSFRSLGKTRNYFSVQPIAGYIGFLGYQNLGDEALYLAFKELFDKFHIVIYSGCINQSFKSPKNSLPIELILYNQLVKRNLYNFVFLGGGTLINREIYLDQLQHTIRSGYQGIVFGTGVCDPSFWKDHNPEIDYSKLMSDWIAVLRDAAYVGVRGPKSAKTLEAYGLPNSRVIGDPALSICQPRSSKFFREYKIGINLGSHGYIWGCQENVNRAIAMLVRHLLKTGWQVEFMPMHSIDLRVGLEFIQKFGLHQVTVWREFTNVKKTINHLQTYDMVVGQRLHSVVLACGCGIPSIMLEYQPKCGDFMDSINMNELSVRTDKLDPDKLLILVEEINANYEKYCEKVISACDHYRMLQKQAAQEIMDLISMFE